MKCKVSNPTKVIEKGRQSYARTQKSKDTMVKTVVVDYKDPQALESLTTIVNDLLESKDVSPDEPPPRVAFDCEGINLSRVGTVELVSLCFDHKDMEGTDTVFLVDLHGTENECNLDVLKTLFESQKIEKLFMIARWTVMHSITVMASS